MEYLKYLSLICLVVGIGVAVGFLVSVNQANGSVIVGNEYTSTTTDSTFGLAGKVLKTGTGSLGSVIITLGSNAPLYIYDGTTTQAHPDWPTTTLAAFPTTATAGTYTFDAVYERGLIVVSPYSGIGTASTTITFR